MNFPVVGFGCLFLLCSTVALAASSGSTTVVGSGSTFIIHMQQGFDDPTYGAGRQASFEAAAQIWADLLVSDVPIEVDAWFVDNSSGANGPDGTPGTDDDPLYCDASTATLGSAGPAYVDFDFPNAPVASTLYPIALANAYVGLDRVTDADVVPGNTSVDIVAHFNGAIDGDDTCMGTTSWYYGTDGNPPGSDLDFFKVVLHELAHGLGFLTFAIANANPPTAIEKNAGYDDHFMRHLKDISTNTSWSAMSDSQRATSSMSNGDLVWSGSGTNSLVLDYTDGFNGVEAKMYAPATYSPGSSVSHFDVTFSPNELMEYQYEANATHNATIKLFEDIGWTIYQESGTGSGGTNTDTSGEGSTDSSTPSSSSGALGIWLALIVLNTFVWTRRSGKPVVEPVRVVGRNRSKQ